MVETTSVRLRSGGPRPRPDALAAIIAFIALFAVAHILYLVGWFLFVLFLRGVAKFFRNGRLARNCVTFIIISFIAIALSIGGLIFLVSVGGPDQEANPILLPFLIASAVIGVFVLVWYITLLVRTRNTIRRAMIQSPSLLEGDS